MARFFGRYEHSLDSKGRVILPAKFRAPFEHGGYLTQYNDGCLALWTPEEFERQMVEMQERASQSRDDRNLARFWAAGSEEVKLDDRSGRMPIPQHLRDFAHLDGDVLVLGAIDRVELWRPDLWESRVRPAERRLTDEDDSAPERDPSDRRGE